MSNNNDNAEERWLPIPGYEGFYEVSDRGGVRSVRRGRELKPHPDRDGYPRVGLCRDGGQWTAGVHALVMCAFVGPRPVGMDIRHLDGDVTNAHVSNLAYGTQAENAQDRLDHGHTHHARKTHCDNGHELSGDNVYTWAKGKPTWRKCRKCGMESARRRRAAKSAKRAANIAALLPLLIVVAALLAPVTKASPATDAYAGRYGQAICQTLDEFPSIAGLTGILNAVVDDGLSAYDSGVAVATAVYAYCPRHLGLLQRFIDRYGKKPSSVYIAGSVGGVLR